MSKAKAESAVKEKNKFSSVLELEFYNFGFGPFRRPVYSEGFFFFKNSLSVGQKLILRLTAKIIKKHNKFILCEF